MLLLDMFLLLGSSVFILSVRLNFFLVSISDVDESVDWLGRFVNFKYSREDEVGVCSLLDCGECSALTLFDSGFEVWFFPKLSILEVEGRIGDLYRFYFLGGVVCICAVVFCNFLLSSMILSKDLFVCAVTSNLHVCWILLGCQ